MDALVLIVLWIARSAFTAGTIVFLGLVFTTIAQGFWLCLREGANDDFEPKYRRFLMGRMALATYLLIVTDVCLLVMFALANVLPAHPE